MIAGDVRTLAREYCERHVAVQYNQYDLLAHIEAASPWIATTMPWLTEHFEGKPAHPELLPDPRGQPADADSLTIASLALSGNEIVLITGHGPQHCRSKAARA